MSETPVPPLEAFDVPAELPLTGNQLAEGATEVAGGILTEPLILQAAEKLKTAGELSLLIFLLVESKEIVRLFNKYVAPTLKDVGEGVVTAATTLIEPIADLFGDFSKVYVGEMARHWKFDKGGGTHSSGTPVGNAAEFAFDEIVAPIAFFTSGSNPADPGAGERNIQQTLGVIVQLHLVTWVVNIISNLTGIGTLKFMNSFTEVMLAALNARSLSRLSMRPYIDTFIKEPATKELNTKFPLKSPGIATDAKQFIRGQITAEELHVRGKEQGFDEEKMAQVAVDAGKGISPTDGAFYVRMGVWTTEQAEQALVLDGYEPQAAHAALLREVTALSFDLLKRYADELGKHVASQDITVDEYVALLTTLGFTDAEAHGYAAIHTLPVKFGKQLDYSQVKQLYLAGLVTLNFVTDFLTRQGYAPDDVSLLVLLDFSLAEERQARKAVLSAQARIAALEKAAEASVKRAKDDQELARALDKLARAKAALAATFGG